MKYACFWAQASFENCFCHRCDYILSALHRVPAFDDYTSFRVPFEESYTLFKAPYAPCAAFYGLSAVCASYMSCLHCVITIMLRIYSNHRVYWMNIENFLPSIAQPLHPPPTHLLPFIAIWTILDCSASLHSTDTSHSERYTHEMWAPFAGVHATTSRVNSICSLPLCARSAPNSQVNLFRQICS